VRLRSKVAVAAAAGGLSVLPTESVSAQALPPATAQEDISFTYFGRPATCTVRGVSQLQHFGADDVLITYSTAVADSDAVCTDALIDVAAAVEYQRASGRTDLSRALGPSSGVSGEVFVSEGVVRATGIHFARFRCDESFLCEAFFNTRTK
jgi:hypothetical protein